VNTSVVPAGTGSSGVSTRGADFFALRVGALAEAAHAACTHVDPSAERAISAAGSIRFAHAAQCPAYLACIRFRLPSVHARHPKAPVDRIIPFARAHLRDRTGRALATLRQQVYGCAMSNPAVESVVGVQSVDRALRILEILARSGESGVTELAAALEVHKSTAFRLVATLEQHRLVEQVEGRGKYRLGVGLLRLAGATSARLDVVQEARPLCKQLAAATGETVNLATLSGNSALYLDQVAGPSALQPHNWVGQHIPLHATSNGKVLMAWLAPAELGDLLGRLPAFTGLTITTKSRLKRELEGVREQGYAVAVDELEVGLTAIAAPVRNAHGDVICSMSLSGPTFRLPSERVAEVVPLLVEAAEELSHRLGWGVR